MQRTARCRWLWWFKCPSTGVVELCWARNNTFLHTSVPKEEITQRRPLQEPSKRSIEEDSRHTEQLRRRNCWKLWKERGLTSEEISEILHMRHETIINIILSYERKSGDPDWHRLCKLVMLTATTARAILVGRVKAKETSSSRGATLFSASDIKNFCPQNVTYSQINLMYVMLGWGLTSSKILDIANFTTANEPTDFVIEGTWQAQNTSTASMNIVERARYTGGERGYGEEEESVGVVASDEQPASKMFQQEKEAMATRNTDYNSEGGERLWQGSILKQHELSLLDAEDQETEALADAVITNVTGQKSLTTSDLAWLRNNNMVTLSDIVNAFGSWEAKHLLFLLLELLLENSCIVEGVLQVPSEQSANSNKLEVPRRMSSQAFSNPLIATRMHRALCLKAVVLKVDIHEPKRDVEFMMRSIRPYDGLSAVYHVHIFKYPSCTCPDFALGVGGGFDYIPCKHLFYVYMVQLGLQKDLEHLMLHKVLKEADLERVLEGYF